MKATILGCLCLLIASRPSCAKEVEAPFAPVFEAVARVAKERACWEEGRFSVLIRREEFPARIADVPLPDAMENVVIRSLGDHAKAYVKSNLVRGSSEANLRPEDRKRIDD